MSPAGSSSRSLEQQVALEAYAALAQVTRAGGATVLQVPEAPDSPMLNRVVGLGIERPATPAGVDAALAALAANVTFYVAVEPRARPPELARWLLARGLEPGWGWMGFRRGVASPPPARSGLRIAAVVGCEEAAAFARVVAESYGLPPAVQPRLARAPEAGWECWLALDGDEPAAAGALYASRGAAYLGLAGTLPQHRGKGAQTALLAVRIARAAELACDLMLTETGERRLEQPSGSYRNILRAGFRETGVTANWRGRTADAA